MSDKPYPRKPDYRLGAMLKDRGLKNKAIVGAAWRNGDGSISIVLDPFIVLRQEGDLLLTLFPKDAAINAEPTVATA